MRTIVLISLLIISCNTIAQSVIHVNVAPGNVSELKNAIIEAGERSPEIQTVILSTGTFTLEESGLPHIKSSVNIQGHPGPIIFEGGGEGPEELIVVDAGATLHLFNVELADFSLNQSGSGLIQNQGKLRLTKVQIRNVNGSQVCLRFGCTSVMPVIFNGENAELFLYQASLINSGVGSNNPAYGGGLITNFGEAQLSNTQVYNAPTPSPPFSNGGTMTLNFTSMYTDTLLTQSLLTSGQDTIMTISNSIVSGFDAEWCAQTQSLGYNFIENAECGFTAEGDRIGESVGLLWRPVEASWNTGGSTKEILTHALVPIQASPAIDSVPNHRCGNDNLLGDYRQLDGNGDGIKLCDAGAVELVPITLGEGGINGIYYNPNADGHYVYILDNDYNSVVMWSTFDNDGKQAWIFGIGELVGGRSLITDAYINLDGRVSLDGEIEQAEAHHWGTLEVEMSNCNEGTIAFNSDRPEFGSGQFNITRLAFVKQLGCVD